MASNKDSNDSSRSNSTFNVKSLADRRGSLASILLPSQLDKKSLATTLDEIHSNASRSEKLTTFKEFAPSRTLSLEKGDGSSTGQLVQGGINSIFTRLKSSVSGTKDNQSANALDSTITGDGNASSSPTPKASSPPIIKESISSSERDASRKASIQPQLQERLANKGDLPTNGTTADAFSTARSNSVTKANPEIPRIPNAAPSIIPSDDTHFIRRVSINKSKKPRRPSIEERPYKSPSETGSPSGSIATKTSIDNTHSKTSTKPLDTESTRSRSSKNDGSQEGREPAGPAKKPDVPTQRKHTSPSPPDLVELHKYQMQRNKSGNASAATGSISPFNHQFIDNSSHRNTRSFLPSKGEPDLQKSQAAITAASKKPQSNNLVNQMRRKILSRDFWMKDENAKVCFHCGDSFSTFRRKHHCRLCGQIYCGSCTDLISGKPFGQASKLRVCKTCEAMLRGDDSSDYSEDELGSSFQAKQIRFSDSHVVSSESQVPGGLEMFSNFDKFQSFNGVSLNPRKSQEARTSTVGLSAYDPHSALSRPSSSRSVRSLRPRSSSTRQSRARHQHLRSLSISTVDEAPFQTRVSVQPGNSGPLAAFHTDSIIDPDLAPYMSDESSDNETPSISSKLNGGMSTPIDLNFSSFFGHSRKANSKSFGRRLFEPRLSGVDTDSISVSSSRAGVRPPMKKTRTLSSGSAARHNASGRVIRSDNLFKSSDDLLALTRGQLGSETFISSRDEPNRRSEALNTDNPSVELNQTYLDFAKTLLRQFLADANVKHPRNWAKALMPILLLCAGSINLDIQRGDDIDIRHYVKLKKAPGGLPHDTSYISGVVFTKNVAIKGMRRSIKNPRILLISFPVEYARQEPHFMSLDPVIAQEREYLRNIVRRIIALRPSVLVVHRQVSGVALQFLKEANITVICNVKTSVLQAVSRCTQTRIVTSVDKLTMDPNHLGKCDLFEVRTFIHQGTKKSYIYVSGCQRDLGCTIVLRGSDRKTLRKLKKITEFMCYVTYNLKLESSLMRDQFLFIPSIIESTPNRKETDLSAEHSRAVSKDTSTLPEFRKSSSPESDDLEVQDAKISVVDGPTDSSLAIQEEVVPIVMCEDLQKRILSISPFVQLAEPFLISKGREEEQKMTRILRLQRERQRYSASNPSVPYDPNTPDFQLVRPEMVYASVQNSTTQVQEIVQAIHKAEYERSSQLQASLKKKWDTYIAEQVDAFSPFTHQRIVLLFSIISTPTSDACEGPDLFGLDFYREHDIGEGQEPDIPLGEYVERLCNQVDSICVAHQCERKMIDHHRQYVHGYGQVSIFVQKLRSRFKGMENTILMWSKCKKCDSETQVTPMSSDAWKYSFGKYLELTFWSKPLHPRAGDCTHDVHREHVKYFGFKNLAVRVEFDPIQLMEVTVPRISITWKVDQDLRLKNDQFEKIQELMDRFFASVKMRIDSINVDIINPTDVEACKAVVESMVKRLDEERSAMTKKLREKYAGSKYYEIIPFNRAIRFMQEKVADWDVSFAEFERNYFPSERDIRRLAALKLKEVFLANQDSATSGSDIEEKVHQALHEELLNEAPTMDEKSPPRAMSPESLSKNPRDQLVEKLDLAVPPESLPLQSHESSGEGTEAESETKSVEKVAVPDASIDTSSSETGTLPPLLSETAGAGARSRLERQASALPRPGPGPKSPSLVRSRTQPLLQVPPTVPPKGSEANLAASHPTRSLQGSRLASAISPMSATSMQLERDRSRSEKSIASAARAMRSTLPSMIPRAINKRRDSKVSELAKHFEQMSREFERERLRERRLRVSRINQSRAYPAPASKPIVEVFKDASEAVREPETSYAYLEADNSNASATQNAEDNKSAGSPTGDDESYSQEDVHKAHANPNPDENDQVEENTAISSDGTSEVDNASDSEERTSELKVEDDRLGEKSSEASAEPTLDIPKHEKSSLMKMLTSFWSERSASGWLPLEYPLAQTDHIFADSDVIVREDEPSSLIAFSLASQDYINKMQQYNERAQNSTDSQRAAMQSGLEDPEDAGTERIMLGNTATHMKYQFQSEASRMQCKIFYAEAFEAMRRKCGVSDRFVESLSRCVKWESKGGKTKSLFLKTLDERLVMKSLSPVEVHAFLKFAPDYFDYMSKCLFHGLPSALAKIIGIFQVVIKNPVTGTDFYYFLQVMENVLYEGSPDHMFDLKGSMRNRRIEPTGEKDEVLLDENLLDYISQSPVYVRHHSSSMLTSSISNDTLFCSKQNVMDYSLIAGLYDGRRELIVGIIDYIRTYTWDKKLESWIKDRGKHKPTVRSPKDYRNRFRASIPRYFPLAPSCWQVFGSQGMAQPLSTWQGHDLIDEEAGVEDSQDEVAVVGGAKSDNES